MRKKDVERSIAGLDEQLRDALLLSMKYTYAESADRLGITADQLMTRVGEAKRRIVVELLGDWQDPGSRLVVDMHIDAAAMNMQRRRRGVLHRVRQWLERLVEQTRVQPWRSGLVPVGAFAVIALAVATSYMMYLAELTTMFPVDLFEEAADRSTTERRREFRAESGRAESDDTGTGGRILLASIEVSSSCGGNPPADGTSREELLWVQECGKEIGSRQNDIENNRKKLEDASQRLVTTWRATETWLEFQDWKLDIQEQQLEFEERLQEIQERRNELEIRRNELEIRRNELEIRRSEAEGKNIDLERERERIEERFRGRQRGSEYRRAFGNYVVSWDKEYRQPLDRYSEGMEEYGEGIVSYVCEILQYREELADLAREYGGTIPLPRADISIDSCPDVETGDGRPVLVRH